MSKRKAFNLSDSISSQQRFEKRHASTASSSSTRNGGNAFQKRPIHRPAEALYFMLSQSRQVARDYISKVSTLPISKPFCEIEARIGILKVVGHNDKRVLPSGPKSINGQIAHAFDITALNNPHVRFEGGVTRTHFDKWTSAGISDTSAISAAFGVDREGKNPKDVLVEKMLVETVYGGYANQNRMCFPGEHVIGRSKGRNGVFENKTKLVTRDYALPAAQYDLRVNLSTEQDLKSLGEERYDNPIHGWTSRRLKRRRSYTRSGFVWQLDVTEVTTSSSFPGGKPTVEYEIEVELNAESTLKLINETDDECKNSCRKYAEQLWWMISNINPLSDVLDVEDFLENHPNHSAVNMALGQCGALKKFMDSRRNGGEGNWTPVIGTSNASSTPRTSLKFPGCMPVNFSRHHIEEVQRSDASGGYYLSEKTDGVRYFMVFTGETVVLVDRTMTGKRVKPRGGRSEPMEHLLSLIKPGTVFDGEVVMNRHFRRPIFIVFDVLTISAAQPILHLPFKERFKHLIKASFRTDDANKDMFDKRLITDRTLNIALPLARKNFVSRLELDEKLLSHVSVEKGLRSYKNGDTHYHLTDGIIFQPNLPYSCGTDVNLLKWKYLDTVTIDVQIAPPKMDDGEDVLRVEVSGEDGSFVDMTRFIHLPNSERRRLEADRDDTKARIAEVGFEPTTGEWYYLTMRPDKIAPNHISTVLGTLLELAESLNTEELRYRMSVPAGNQDTFRKQIRRMQKQLLEHQRSENKKLASRSR